MALRKCKWCGTEFMPATDSQIFCNAQCRVKFNHRLASQRRRQRKLSTKTATTVSAEKCKTCVYSRGYNMEQADVCCMYIVITGERRGCPGGDECTKYKPRTGKRVKPIADY